MAGETIGIVGAGITGACTANYLSRRSDRRVVVFERDEVAAETTAKSAGYVGVRASHTAAHRALMTRSIHVYNRVIREADADVRHRMLGGLNVATTAAGRAALRDRHRSVTADGDGADAAFARFFDGETIRESLLLPDVRLDGLTAAWFWPNYGYVTPAALATAFADRARDAGAEFRTDTTVLDLERDATGAIDAVRTDRGRTPVDQLVLAAGPWNPTLARSVGVDLPVRHSVAPGVLVDDPTASVHPSLTHHESGVYLRPHGDGQLFIGHYQGDFAAAAPATANPEIPADVPADLRAEILEGAGRLVYGLEDPTVRDQWVGLRSLTPDGNPIVGWTDVDGLLVATYNATGIQHAPAVGHILSQQLLGDEPTQYYDLVSISRFEGYSDVYDGAPT
ncbi:NAD(P)/FAD-dependent oxidoreductase [Halobellus clavatus]|uniref:Sarcosine oxidase subunit beta n=1 Tax=Halobellus clavatus TaxID=660517 RepID=A0A1H3ICW2_9EURY|nr:FAD-dependent oxidoreductase [Halobellus clavatus]SDY25541.1 sarcosine oxidase subunit beta [Halobellus clavatus]